MEIELCANKQIEDSQLWRGKFVLVNSMHAFLFGKANITWISKKTFTVAICGGFDNKRNKMSENKLQYKIRKGSVIKLSAL